MRAVVRDVLELMVFIGIPILVIGAIAMILFILGDIGNGADSAFGSEFDKRNAFIEQCLASENYTRDECIQLARPKVSK